MRDGYELLHWYHEKRIGNGEPYWLRQRKIGLLALRRFKRVSRGRVQGYFLLKKEEDDG